MAIQDALHPQSPTHTAQSWRGGSHTERFHLRELVSLPGLLTLVRAPLAAAFPLSLDKPVAALGILAAAGASDVLDGWSARRSGRTTLTGAILDPVMDKLFVGTVVVTLLIAGRVSILVALLLGLRDLIQLPLVFWLALDPRTLAGRSGAVKANAFGKVVTVFQYATVVAALTAGQYVPFIALVSGASGVVAGATYWSRVFRNVRIDHHRRGGLEAPWGGPRAKKTP